MAPGPINKDTLGAKLELPTQIGTDAQATTADGDWEQRVAANPGEPPEEWDRWTLGADKGLRLLQVLGLERPGAAYRGGGGIRSKNQTISRCQDGKYGTGTNRQHGGTHRAGIAVWGVFPSLPRRSTAPIGFDTTMCFGARPRSPSSVLRMSCAGVHRLAPRNL